MRKQWPEEQTKWPLSRAPEREAAASEWVDCPPLRLARRLTQRSALARAEVVL